MIYACHCSYPHFCKFGVNGSELSCGRLEIGGDFFDYFNLVGLSHVGHTGDWVMLCRIRLHCFW
jgi:hypothetical protein